MTAMGHPETEVDVLYSSYTYVRFLCSSKPMDWVVGLINPFSSCSQLSQLPHQAIKHPSNRLFVVDVSKSPEERPHLTKNFPQALEANLVSAILYNPPG